MLQGVLDDTPTDGTPHQGERPPVRPSSAPPARGRRPLPSSQQTSATVQLAAVAGDGDATANRSDGDGMRDGNSSGGDSRDLRGFDELEGSFSYDDYPVAGSPEEEEWVHVPWCGTNSGDIPVRDHPPRAHQVPPSPSCDSTPPGADEIDGQDGGKDAEDNTGQIGSGHGNGEGAQKAGAHGSTSSIRLAAATSVEKLSTLSGACPVGSPETGGVGEGDGERSSVTARQSDSRRNASGTGTGSPSARWAPGEGGLTRYDWDATKVPQRPSLAAASRIPSGSRAEKIKARNSKKRNPNKKVG